MQKQAVVFLLVLVITVTGVYWRQLDSELIWDSRIFLEDNLALITGQPVGAAFEIGYFYQKFSLQSNYYRPLTLMSFMLEQKLWGIDPGTMRGINLIIYLLALLALYQFFRLQTQSGYFPEIATLLFALFPLNLDNIMWVVGRGDLLLLLFAVLSLLSLAYFIRKGKWGFLAASSLFYLLGLFSKESILFLFPVLIIYEAVKRKKINGWYHGSNALLTVAFFGIKIGLAGIKNPQMFFHENIWENIQAALAAVGYYLRSLMFPWKYDFFIPENQFLALKYLLLGIAAAGFFAVLLWLSRKNKSLLVPLSLIFFFAAGHLVIVFTSVFQFKVYSRYMMIPALGLIWIGSFFLIKLKEKLRLAIWLLLVISFIPSVILNAYHYQSEVHFWRNALNSFPRNGYILYEMARSARGEGDELSAEIYLNQTLQSEIEKETALLVSLMYADLEYQRARYDYVFNWLESMEELAGQFQARISPFWAVEMDLIRAKTYAALGDVDKAEKELKDSISMTGDDSRLFQAYQELYSLYVGHHLWDKAAALQREMESRFGGLIEMDTERVQNSLEQMPAPEKVDFYIQNKNYAQAADILESMPELSINRKLTLIQLYHRLGQEETAQRLVEELLRDNPKDIKLLNSLGNFYITHLVRVRSALTFYEESLELNPKQENVQMLVIRLRENYLDRLIDVWPDEEAEIEGFLP